MEQNHYVDALLKQPYLAATIRALIDDGLIDQATAELLWRAIREGQPFRAEWRCLLTLVVTNPEGSKCRLPMLIMRPAQHIIGAN